MKKSVIISILFIALMSCKSIIPTGQCDKLYVDLDKGTLNGIKGTASMSKIKEAFPCFTAETKEGSKFNCGGGVFFIKHDFYFYTYKDYIEIRAEFKGKSSWNLLNNSLENLIKVMGKPDNMTETYDSSGNLTIGINLYQMSWGTLAFTEDDSKITEIQLYYEKGIDEIDFCN